MSKLSMNTKISMKADDLWDAIGKFSALSDWHPMIESSQLEEGGRIRRVRILGGGEIVERLEKLDSQDRLYRYSIISGPIPVANYTATLRVKDDPDSDGAIVEWSSEFEPAGVGENDAVKMIQDLYQQGFDNLRKMFGG